jgi:hypothetical protein
MTRRSLATKYLVAGASALVIAACAAKTPAPAAAPAPPASAPAAAAPAAPPPSAPAPSPASPVVAGGASQPTTPAAAGAPGAATPAGAPGAAAPGGRAGGRGNPPPPVPPVPEVMPAPVTPVISATPPSPDLRVGLKAGYWDAQQAAWNIKLVSTTPPPEGHRGITNSDLAFTGKYVVQGNYAGILFWDVSDPKKPVLANRIPCPASQNDVSVYKHLLFVSSEGTNARLDCGSQGVPEPISKDRIRGIRIFDISDIKNPKYVANVQTCRGSHTHTVLQDPNDKDSVYIYVSGSAGVRSPEELPGCVGGSLEENPDSAQFRVEVIKVPLAAPEKAAVGNYARIFGGLAEPPRRVEPPRGGGAAPTTPGAAASGTTTSPATPPPASAAPPAAGAAAPAAGAPGGRAGGRGGAPAGPRLINQCHDITVYGASGFAGGACGGYGLLLDIREPTHPIRIDAAGDINMSYWHSATFSNDGTKVLFSDEWGGGSAPRCRETDRPEWGGDAIFTIERGKLVFHSYYKMPAAQTEFENCVAHNGSMIPVPGRDIMVQGFYQGGITVFDWTDPKKAFEIAYFDRGPLNAERLQSAGSWSIYWHNGLIYSSEISRGLDIFELVPTPLLSQNEIDAAKTVTFSEANAQDQKKFVWPPSFAMARAFVDQLERSKGLSAGSISSTRSELTRIERLSGSARRAPLQTLGTKISAEAAGSSDQAKVKMLVTALNDLAAAQR